ncbi:hypothetical protein C3B79_1990 [Aeromonas hydrophila]|nr:hypothetical protein C3B79_1990 [Aeromonas hydrophila]
MWCFTNNLEINIKESLQIFKLDLFENLACLFITTRLSPV